MSYAKIQFFATNRCAPDGKMFMLDLTSHAVRQPGYISGETLFNLEQTDECVVISRWTTLEHWRKWNRTPRRMEIDNGMEALLAVDTEYKFYGVGLW